MTFLVNLRERVKLFIIQTNLRILNMIMKVKAKVPKLNHRSQQSNYDDISPGCFMAFFIRSTFHDYADENEVEDDGIVVVKMR